MSETPFVCQAKQWALVNRIAAASAHQLDVNVREVLGRGRSASVAAARQVAMAALMRVSNLSSDAIGCAFGRDRSTVLHAVKRCGQDEALQELVGIVLYKTGFVFSGQSYTEISTGPTSE